MQLSLFDIAFYTVAVVVLLIGLLLIFFPYTLVRMERFANTILLTDSIFLKKPRTTGAVLMSASIYILYTYYRFA